VAVVATGALSMVAVVATGALSMVFFTIVLVSLL